VSRQSVKVQPKEREKPRYDRASPFRVRWSVDGVATERNFPLEEDADAFRKTLEKAVADGVRWNARTLLPATKVDARKLRVAEWCQEFYRADAVTSAPNSRRTSGVTLTRFVEVATESDVTWTTPERSAMRRWITTPGVVLPHNSYCGSNTTHSCSQSSTRRCSSSSTHACERESKVAGSAH